ncbi:MAG: hypothetical protein KFB93_03555 [Simkaniaceae bacterium]|nr:MAG: hypothetical protein KFB93_03555 [Simkaniaceae bacterium]
MSHDCTLCLQNAVFPVRFVSSEAVPMGQDYHLVGACCHLAEQLLASEGLDPEILDHTITAVISLEQVPIEARHFNYFDTEKCDHAELVQNGDVQALAFKLMHRFTVSAVGETPKSIDKREWIELRDEYRRETEVTNDCWLKQLYSCWVNMGTGGRTAFMAFGSLAVWGVQGIWEAAFYPQGKPKDDEKKPPCSSPINLDKYKEQVTHRV